MTWFIFPDEKDERLVLIIAIIVLLLVGSCLRPFLMNPYWIAFIDIGTPILNVYLLFLSLFYGIQEIRNEIYEKLKQEYEALIKK